MTVHPSPVEAASAILHFWFDELSPAQHWLKSRDMDSDIADRFGPVRAKLLAEGAADWCETPETLLAAIILTDQFYQPNAARSC